MLPRPTSLLRRLLFLQNLGEEGTQYIIEALAYNEVCTALDLSNNGIGPLGATAVAQALEFNDMLQSFVMDTNNIGDEGAEVLAKYMSGVGFPLCPHASAESNGGRWMRVCGSPVTC
jgi:Ran GTPase-activating protein (RanGAP) involved in mRNA processing and transport